MSTLVRVACASCDGTIVSEAEDAACPWCGTQLLVRRAGGAAWTQLAEDAAAVTGRAEQARRLTTALRTQRQLAAEEGAWTEERALLTWWTIREPRARALWLLGAEVLIGTIALIALAVVTRQAGVGVLAGAAGSYALYTIAGALHQTGTSPYDFTSRRHRHAGLRAQIDAVLGVDGPWAEPPG